jgi:P27 family predicted phage terminase small subunit
MGLRGPAPMPYELRVLRGSATAKRTSSVKPARSIPTCPRVLKGESRRVWKRLTAELNAMGLLYGCDLAMLTALAEAWGEFVETSTELNTTGKTFTTDKGYVAVHPLVGIKNAAAERVVKISREFGLSPSARTRIQQPEESKPDDFEGFIANRHGSQP